MNAFFFSLEKTQICIHTPTLSGPFKLHSFYTKKLYFISNRNLTLPYLFISSNHFKLKMLPVFWAALLTAIYGGCHREEGKYSESVGKKVCITESEERNSFTEIWLAQQTYSVHFSGSMSAQSSIPTSCFLLRGWEKGETSWEQTKRCHRRIADKGASVERGQS